MPNTIERPVFVEGQVLSARDLNTISELSRRRDARHARHAHLWGIVRGLDLSVDNRVLKIAPGVAIDSSGAELLVDEEILVNINELQFTPKSEAIVPVFIQKTTKVSQLNSLGACRGPSGQSRASESIELILRENATDWDQQGSGQSMSQGEANSSNDPRPVLLGFVKIKDKIFDSPTGSPDSIELRYLGVRAETVIAVKDSLRLRGADFGTPNTPVIEINQAKRDPDEKTFAFSIDDGSGNRKPVFTVDENGNVHAMGAISSELKLAAGSVLVQSGIATDGAPIPIPLPPGVSRNDPSIAVHIQVTPILEPDESEPPIPNETQVVSRCFVEDDDTLRCIVRGLSFNSAGTASLDARFIPGRARYLVIVTSKGSSK